MMKNLRLTLIIAALLLGMTGLLPINAQAQLTKRFVAAGSSAMYQSFAMAAGLNGADGEGDYGWCANQSTGVSYHWTYSNGANLLDPRSSSINPEPGNIWIVWDNSTAPTQICLYVSVDSIVGTRAYFAGATVSILEAANTPGQNKIAYFGAGTDTALPAAVLAAANGLKINVGMTDIRPEDAYFATLRALTPIGTRIPRNAYTGLGYNSSNPGIGTSIQSSQLYSGTPLQVANPVDFSIYTNDPFTNAPHRVFYTALVGANPVVVFANVSNTGAGHFGDGKYTNINRSTLANILTGQITRISDIYAAPSGSGDTAVPIHVYQREPLSGTFNTMEFCVPLARELYNEYSGPGVVGAETGVNPANTSCAGAQPCSVESGNPFWHITTSPGLAGATRGRVVGTGEMVKTVNLNADSLGYAFWSFANFNGDNTALRYLTVDGVDPFYASSSANPVGVGQLPQCTSFGPPPSCPILPFPNIVNGSYPIWSFQRMIYDYTDTLLTPLGYPPVILSYVHLIATNKVTDFTDATEMGVFRSHFYQIVDDASDSEFPNNGFKNDVPETGGDMGGLVLTVQSELDYITDTTGPSGTEPCTSTTGCQQTNLYQ
jgi:ABC-type phosphate transport system substrate-binding protein